MNYILSLIKKQRATSHHQTHLIFIPWRAFNFFYQHHPLNTHESFFWRALEICEFCFSYGFSMLSRSFFCVQRAMKGKYSHGPLMKSIPTTIWSKKLGIKGMESSQNGQKLLGVQKLISSRRKVRSRMQQLLQKIHNFCHCLYLLF